MKINEDLVIYTAIFDISNEEGWSISANINKNGYYMPSLENKKTKFYADASGWLLRLYENLKELIKPKIDRDEEKFLQAINFEKEEISEIQEEDYPIIVDLIKQAIELGFFREYYDKSK